MISNKNISEVLDRIERSIKEFSIPVVTYFKNVSASPFQILISTILSLRTKDDVTKDASLRLFTLAKTPNEILRLSPEVIQKAIYPVGFYKNKTKSIIEISRILLEKYKGKVPNDLDELLLLPGVGRKTANLVLTEAFDIPAMCVDVHVHRISNRFGYIKTKDPLESEFALRKKLPIKHWNKYNLLLVTFGQNICKPISPYCSRCPINQECSRVGVQKSR
ncbi:MAG TPA: endonuclease III [Candidatus Woesearchaeota archaeon]|nr:endonuclease III [Candidatus Woesearchaeota archaeon]